MKVEVPLVIDIGQAQSLTQENIKPIIEAIVSHYIHTELTHSKDGWCRSYKGTDAIDEYINDAIKMEVKFMVASQLDKIVKRAITNTAISIRNNPKYDVIRDAVADALKEADTPQTEQRKCYSCKHFDICDIRDSTHEFCQFKQTEQAERKCSNCKHLTYRFNKVWCDIKADNPHDEACDKWQLKQTDCPWK